VIGFGFTGYLLPWDQRSYWATVIGIEIASQAPFIGDFLGRFLRGGSVPGAMTLSRFFVIHVMILPAALMAIAGLHIFLFRKAGPAGPYKGTTQELKTKMEYFFPTQVWKDIVVMGVVFVVVCALAIRWPHEMLEEASPVASGLNPEPEWYFLFLFQLLRDPALSFLFAGQWGEFLGAILLPTVFLLLLVSLPFIDRSPERNIFKRPIALTSWVVVLTSIVILTIRAIMFRE